MTEHTTHSTVTTRPTPQGPVVVLAMDNGEGRRPNTMGRHGLQEFSTSLDQVEEHLASGPMRALLVTGKPGSFLAGADLASFRELASPTDAAAFSHDGKVIFSRLRTFGVPVIAVLDGMALGGGLELALFCDHRVATRRARFLGFPEAHLGLVPGWAGCHHLPRLIGPEAALEVLVDNPLAGNRLLTVEDALSLGIIDDVVEDIAQTDTFVGSVLSGCAAPASGIEPSSASARDADWAPAVWESALEARRPMADRRAAAGAFAVERILTLVESARVGNRATAFARDTEFATEASMSASCRRSLYAFDLLGRRAHEQASPDRDTAPVAHALASAVAGLPHDLDGVGLEEAGTVIPTLVRAVSSLLDDGWSPTQVDTVALAELGWPLYFGGVIPLLDAIAGTGILPPGVASVPAARGGFPGPPR